MLNDSQNNNKVIANLSQLQPPQEYLNSDRCKAFKRVNELILKRTIALTEYMETYY